MNDRKLHEYTDIDMSEIGICISLQNLSHVDQQKRSRKTGKVVEKKRKLTAKQANRVTETAYICNCSPINLRYRLQGHTFERHVEYFAQYV